MATAYWEKLRDPKWQRKRLEVMQRDEFTCQHCFDSESTLNVHHRAYIKGNEPWEYPNDALVTLCEDCHRVETEGASSAMLDLLCALWPRSMFESDSTRCTDLACRFTDGFAGAQLNAADAWDFGWALLLLSRWSVTNEPRYAAMVKDGRRMHLEMYPHDRHSGDEPGDAPVA